MKLYRILFTTVIVCNLIIPIKAQEKITSISGTVHNWPGDTVYLQTMPFYSPNSSVLKYQILTQDSTFSFELTAGEIPHVVQIYPRRENVNINREQLLELNYTSNYYYGLCRKFYTYGVTTLLVEAGSSIDVELTCNHSWKQLSREKAERFRNLGARVTDDDQILDVRETEIRFNGLNTFQDEYYQSSFSLEDKIDKHLELYNNKPVEEAIESYHKIMHRLLVQLESNRNELSDTFYEYIKAEIEFGGRLEFMKYLMFNKMQDQEGNPTDFFSKEISKEILDILEFNKNSITPPIMANEEYNKYLELYMNFQLNKQNGYYQIYYDPGKQKFKTAIQVLPEKSLYFYISNQFLQNDISEDFAEELLIETLKHFPDGELNEKLMDKYDL